MLGGWLRRLYLRKPRMPLQASVLNFTMRLDPAENIDSALLFYPQLYEHHEIRFLRDHLRAAEAAAGKGDWATYGTEMATVHQLLDQLAAAAGR